MNNNKILITCSKGIPPILKKELLALHHPVLSESVAGVETAGSLDDAMGLNLHIRTGHRVLSVLGEFRARNASELYRAVARFAWEEYIPEDGYLSVTSSTDNPTIRDSRFASLKCKDAIVDRIKGLRGVRPDSGPDRDRTVVHLYWKDDRCTLYLDTSGEPLAKRGYRGISLGAPMRETLAAAVVLATGWNGSTNFINPMCGSGTLAIEAALIALNRAPGLERRNFGFMHLKGFDRKRWSDLREQAAREVRKTLAGRIIASDIDPRAVEAARKNAAAAGVESFIEFSVSPFAETPLPGDGGVVVLNPAYGERMGETAELEETYREIGDFFKQKCGGYTGFVFTGNPSLGKRVGLKPNETHLFYNSGIECRLLAYEVYEGSRKKQKHFYHEVHEERRER